MINQNHRVLDRHFQGGVFTINCCWLKTFSLISDIRATGVS